MIELLFCPKCGKDKLHWDSVKKWNCQSCNYIYYHNCAAAVAVVLIHEEQIMLTVRNREPQKGLLDLAGGFVDPNETAETTCQRELMEELGWQLDVNQLKYITSYPNTYFYGDILYHTLDLFYEYHLDEKPVFIVEKTEIQSVEWINIQQIDINKMAFESQKKFLQKHYLDA